MIREAFRRSWRKDQNKRIDDLIGDGYTQREAILIVCAVDGGILDTIKAGFVSFLWGILAGATAMWLFL